MTEMNYNWNLTLDKDQYLYPDWIPMNLPLFLLPNPRRHCFRLVQRRVGRDSGIWEGGYTQRNGW